MTKVFIDTNILVYACDGRDPEKQRIAENLLGKTASEGSGVISTQTLLEFFNTAINKLKQPPKIAKRLAEGFEDFEVVQPGPDAVFEAMDLVTLHSLSTLDALVLSTAISAKCKTVYSEDMQDGFKIRGLTVMNPFAEGTGAKK